MKNTYSNDKDNIARGEPRLVLANSRLDAGFGDPTACLKMLGIGKTHLCAYDQGIKVVEAHNGNSRRRRLDFPKAGFRSLRHAYGASLGWILGDVNLRSETLNAISTAVGASLDAFWRGSNAGVIVMSRQYDALGTIMTRQDSNACQLSLLEDESISLLVPTGRKASALGGGELYERIDLAESHTCMSDFAVAGVYFTGEDGELIAGLGDVDAGMYGLRDVHVALQKVLGDEYSLIDVNRKIGSSWLHHLHADPYGEEIAIPLVEIGEGKTNVTLVMERIRLHSWEFRVLIDGEVCTPSMIARKPLYMISVSDVLHERKRVEDAFLRLKDIREIVEFETILDEHHINRFPSEFVGLTHGDRDMAVSVLGDAIIDSFSMFCAQHSYWPTTQFMAGHEKFLHHSGDEACLSVQLLIPLELTANDKRFHSPSVYAVAELSEDGNCKIPSVLDTRMVVADVNNLCCAITSTLCKAA